MDFSLQYGFSKFFPSLLKLAIVTKNQLTFVKVMKQNLSKTWCATFFRLPWENLNFSLTIRPSLKSLEDITDNGHKQNISLILISLR